jgi:hypothetical protein
MSVVQEQGTRYGHWELQTLIKTMVNAKHFSDIRNTIFLEREKMWLLVIKQYQLFVLIMPYCTFVHHFLNQKHIHYSYIDSIYWSCTIRTITVYKKNANDR